MIFLLKRRDEDVGWDEASGFVVRAGSEEEARRLIADRLGWVGDEGPAVWLDPAKSTCEIVWHAGEPAVVLRDFHAG